MTRSFATGLVLLLLSLSAPPHPARAQERPDSVVPLQPVIVRVLRSTTAAGIPAPVTVLSARELAPARARFLEEALQAVPGLQVQNRFNLASGERVAIRGFGARTQFGIRSLRVYVDGVPATLADGQTTLDHVDPEMMERVEILRGPGAALYGNAAGGVIHLRTGWPGGAGGGGGLRGSAAASVGAWGSRYWRVGVSGPRTSGARAGEAGRAGGAGISVSRMAFDGFRPNPLDPGAGSYGGAHRTVLNGRVALPVAGGILAVVANGLDMFAENPGSLARAARDEGSRAAYRFNVVRRTREDVRQGQLGLSWAGPFGALDAEVAAWGIRRDFFGAIPPRIVSFDRNAAGARGMVRGARATSVGTLILSGGLEVEIQSDERSNWANDGGEKGEKTLSQDERVRGAGLFVQGRLDLFPELSLAAGLRYDRHAFEVTDRFPADGSDDSGSRVMDAWSPSIGLEVNPVPGWELFASGTSFFETPTTTQLANRPDGSGGFNPMLDPVRGFTWEAGARGRVGARWYGEAVVFRTTVEGELIPFEVEAVPGRSFYRNAGSSKHTGWEAAVDGKPASFLDFRVAYTRVNARFTSYAVGGSDYAGRRVPGVPSAWLDGVITLGGAPGRVRLRVFHRGALPVNDENTERSPAQTVMGVKAELAPLSAGSATLTPWVAVDNVTDRLYDASVVVNAFGGRYYEPGPGRSFRVGVSAVWR
ncbi:MAG: TonB-dependent receptor family protein [Gemmatimonadota bacterium]